MARIASVQIAGYYPTPTPILSSCASILRWRSEPRTSPRAVVLDPCAGDGEAIITLRQHWAEALGVSTSCLEIKANEMEGERATALAKALPSFDDQTSEGDAFHLHFSGRGADVLWLNPPYDFDAEERRLELKFLKRFTPALRPSTGVLFFLVPFGVLAQGAEFLSRHFLDIRAWRLPDPHYAAFKQVLLVARRSPSPLAPNPNEQRLRRWGSSPHVVLDPLPKICPEPIEITASAGDLTLKPMAYDLSSLLADSTADDHIPQVRGLDARDLLGGQFDTAMPPRAAHIALALASGMFNGLELAANDPRRHPPVLVKGVFHRKLLEISERRDKDGDLTATVHIERPQLHLTALRLDTYDFLTLAPGTVSSGSRDPGHWNAADLILNYERSLADLLAGQFPPLHDPLNPAHRVALPDLARKPYVVQDHAICCALKLLAQGQNPFLVADVGTGKSTMGLFIAAACSPDHHAATLRELGRLGITTHTGSGARRRPTLPVVRRTLILCPPHLIDSWTDQTRAVLPSVRIQVLRKLGDIEADADVYILSREAAKLGHGYCGLRGACPTCGTPIATSPEKNAAKRLTCPARRRQPTNSLARLARDLARLIAPARPQAALVLSSGLEPAFLDRCLSRARPGSLRLETLRSFQRQLFATVRDLLRQEEPSNSLYGVLEATTELARVTASRFATAQRLSEVAASHGSSYRTRWCSDRAEILRQELLEILKETSDEAAVPPAKALLRALEQLHLHAEWSDEEVCGERLYQAVPEPRRYPLARRIAKRYCHRFDLVLLDEAHEYAHQRSAQTHAAHRLVGLPRVRTVVLTGTLMGGYASSLFSLFWALSPRFREEFERTELFRFIERYGYQKVLIRHDSEKRRPADVTYGRQSDRQTGPRQRLGEAPGVMPTFLMRHLLHTSIIVHKSDLDDELPPLTETPVALEASVDHPLDQELLSEYQRLQELLLDRIKKDRFTPGHAGKLLGALVELPSYLDRAAAECGPFTVAYPDSLGGAVIAEGRSFPDSYLTPKERFLMAELRQRLAAGERVVVFLRHTGGGLPARLLRLIQQQVTASCRFLDAKRVSAAKREAWLDRHIIAKGVRVLLLNPNTVRTGLNNLVAFTSATWHEHDYSSTTYEQANGRFHRIGQVHPVTINYPYFAGTAQETAFRLIARKVTAAHQVSGLDIQSSLEAAGAGDEATTSLETALALGEALYRQLTEAA